MAKQMTKEELQKQIAILEEDKKSLKGDIEALQDHDEKVRDELTQILTGRESGTPTFGRVSTTFSWLKICSEVGKLLVDRELLDLKQDMRGVRKDFDKFAAETVEFVKGKSRKCCEEEY